MAENNIKLGLIIVAAGLGSRLGVLTTDRPKCLVEINGKPILWYILKNIAHFSWERIVIVVGYKGDQIISFQKSAFPHLDVSFVFNPDFEKTGCLDSLMLAPQDSGVDFWCYTNSDLLLSFQAYERVFLGTANNCIGVRKLAENNLPETVLQKAYVSDGKVRRMDLTLETDFNHEAVGPVKLSTANFELIRSHWLSPSEDQPTDNRCYSAIGARLGDFELDAVVICDADWAEINTPKDINRAQRVVYGFGH